MAGFDFLSQAGMDLGLGRGIGSTSGDLDEEEKKRRAREAMTSLSSNAGRSGIFSVFGNR
jgi:hypothetical protein